MSRICIFTKKKTQFGNNRSHAMNATKRKFYTNLHIHKYWIKKKNKFIKLRLSCKAIKIIDKKGINYILNKYHLLKK